MAEELRFEQVLRQGGAIDWHKGGELAPAVEVQRSCHQLFARAAFAQDQDRAVSVRHAFDEFLDFLHFGRAADDLAELVFLFAPFTQMRRFCERRLVDQRPLHA